MKIFASIFLFLCACCAFLQDRNANYADLLAFTGAEKKSILLDLSHVNWSDPYLELAVTGYEKLDTEACSSRLNTYIK